MPLSVFPIIPKDFCTPSFPDDFQGLNEFMAHSSLSAVTILSARTQSVALGVRTSCSSSCTSFITGKCVFVRRFTTSSLDLVYEPSSRFSISEYTGSFARALLSLVVVFRSLTSSQNLSHDFLFAALNVLLYSPIAIL